MLFNSVEFILFLSVVVVLYYTIPKRLQYILLLVVSYLFYANWNRKYTLLLAASTLITYFSGLGLDICNEKIESALKRVRMKKIILVACCGLNLGLLCFFKYLYFILHNITKLTHYTFDLPFDILLPVGISFYIFQALGYIIDVYRGDIKAEKNLAYYSLFVSFFPQLVAGPIERSGNLLKQLREKHYYSDENFLSGFWIMLLGYFEKCMIADRIAIYVDAVFADYAQMGGMHVPLAIAGFAIQIYCDFSGYSHIAIGTARILGIDLMDNFRQPYFSANIKDFWRRWHISLSTWFRDYLYIPLGGNRKGKWRKYINLVITFLVSGLWHGAAWHYVIWGGIHGLYQVIGEWTQPIRKRLIQFLHIKEEGFLRHLCSCSITFVLVSFAWLFFRAENEKKALEMIRYSFGHWYFIPDIEIGLGRANLALLLFAILILFALSLIREKKINLLEFLLKQKSYIKFLFTLFVTMGELLFGVWGSWYDASSFIYFQF